MTLPVAPLKLPADLVGQSNGEISQTLLTLCGIGNFKMHHLASRALRAMIAAYEPTTEDATGTYRTYTQQVLLFTARYTTTPIAGRPTKIWDGVTYWQKPNTAMAAVPGTSNHGLGLAIDFSTGMARYNEFVAWLIINAATYGYSAEAQSESWHWRYVAGDNVPPAVLAFEKPTPPLPPPSSEDDMYLATLSNGDIVVVGSSVRPVSFGEADKGGPYENLPRFTPDPASNWHAWLRAAANEYAKRVMV
jgi:hypothetical protein